MSGTVPSCRRICASTCASSTHRARSSRRGATSAQLRAQLGEAAQLSFAAAGPEFERTRHPRPGISATCRRRWRSSAAAAALTGYPALVVDGDSAALRLYDTREAAEAATRIAVVRLIRQQLEGRAAALGEEPAGIRRRGAAAEDRDSDRRAACRRARRGRRPGVHRRRSAAALGARVRRAGQARASATSRGRRRRVPACWPRSPPITTRCRSGWPRCRRRKRASAPRSGRNAPRWSIRDSFRPRPGRSSRTCRAICRRWTSRLAKARGRSGPGRQTRANGRRALGSLPGAGRGQPGGTAGRTGARSVSLAARGTEGFAVCPGASDAFPGVIQTSGKGLGGAYSSIDGVFLHWRP